MESGVYIQSCSVTHRGVWQSWNRGWGHWKLPPDTLTSSMWSRCGWTRGNSARDSISQPAAQFNVVTWLSAPPAGMWVEVIDTTPKSGPWDTDLFPVLHLPMNCAHADESESPYDGKATRWTEPGCLNDHVEQTAPSPRFLHLRTGIWEKINFCML